MKKLFLLSITGFFLSAPPVHALSFQEEQSQLLGRQRVLQLEIKKSARNSARLPALRREMLDIRRELQELKSSRQKSSDLRKQQLLRSRRGIAPVNISAAPLSPITLSPLPTSISPSIQGFESGKASYYAEMFNGRKTASGAIFSNADMTAAHRTLPFGTRVRVRNVSNGNTIEVTVTDRGPFVAGRIIDLTSNGFSQLDNLSRGVIDVEIEVLD